MSWSIDCKCGRENCRVVAYVDKVRGGYLVSIHENGSTVSEFFTKKDFVDDVAALLREGGGKLHAFYGSDYATATVSLLDLARLYAWM